jgi:hypothetical protein
MFLVLILDNLYPRCIVSLIDLLATLRLVGFPDIILSYLFDSSGALFF